MGYVREVMHDPEIYAGMTDDSCPASDKLDDASIESIDGFFLRVLKDGVSAGWYWLIWKGDGVEAHTALLPNCRGKSAVVATRMAIRWVFENTVARVITSYAWSDSPAVRFICRAVGMAEGRTEPWHATRRGLPVRITYFSIPREAVL